jgi:oligoribonuclease
MWGEFRASLRGPSAPALRDNERMSAPLDTLSRSDQNLVWLDCEMTGLDPEKERIIEIAVIVTGAQLTPRIEGPVLVIHQSDALLDAMDAWNKGTHGRSGLIDKVRASSLTEADAEAQLLEFVRRYVPKGAVPLCGNSIGQDRRFLARYMPRLEAFLHYRNVDVSTLKELARRWKPSAYSSFKKAQKHTALADVHESIDELAHYRAQLFAPDALAGKPEVVA